MAVSPIEEKILGRLAKQTAPVNALLSASLYQVLGLSILLSRKLYRARKLRKLDNTRDTKSLQLYHHIIWLAREGLSITEVYILPYCQDGEQGPECRVMAAKLRASLYHVFCLFHNHPPISQLSGRSYDSTSPLSSSQSPQVTQGTKSSPKKSSLNERDSRRQRSGKAALRDPIPSITSDASYVTNPYATAQTPPPRLATFGSAAEARRTPTRPPGLAPINISPTLSAASFLLPPLNFVPMAREHFDSAQHLANTLLPPTSALRLSIALEHAAFLWDCAKEHERARKLARRTIKDVYSSADGLDDDEFADASALVQALGGIVRRGSNDSTPRPSSNTLQQQSKASSPNQRKTQQSAQNNKPLIDRTIAVSPAENRNRRQAHNRSNSQPQPNISHIPRSMLRTPERLSTVPEVESTDEAAATTVLSPPVSRLSSRSEQPVRRTSSVTSAASDKASKRKIVEAAEERALSRQSQRSSRRSRRSGKERLEDGAGEGEGSQPHSRQATPPEGYVRTPS